MRPFRLIRIAAEAELVRLKAMVGRIVTRAILAVIALIFLLGALTFGHVAAWYWVRTGLEQSFLASTGIVGGVDLLLAIILLVLASRSSPSHVEVEAMAVRRKAMEGLTSAVSLTQLTIPIVRLAAGLRRRR